MNHQAQTSPVDRIEIYSDATWLPRQPRNASEAGGWGAVVLEYRGSECTPRLISGPTGKEVDSTVKAEVYGAYMALRDVSLDYDLSGNSVLPKITLYVDYLDLVKELENLGKNLNHKAHRYSETHGEPIKELAALTRAMDVSAQYAKGSHIRTSDVISNPREYAAKAHFMARQEAWRSRLKEQGFIVNAEGIRLQGIPAMNAIDQGIRLPDPRSVG